MQMFLMTSRFKEEASWLGKLAIIVPLVLLVLMIVPLLMLCWIYEGPKRLVVKVLKKGRD